jgi:hypothetical protein
MVNNSRSVLRHQSIICLLAAFMGTSGSNHIHTNCSKSASTERQQCFVIHLWQLKGCVTASSDNWSIGCLYGEIWSWWHPFDLPKISFNGVNGYGGSSVSYIATNCIESFLNWEFNNQSFHYSLIYNFTTMYAMSSRSSFFLVLAVQLIFKNQLSTTRCPSFWPSL